MINRRTSRSKYQIKDLFWIVLSISIVGYFIYKVFLNSFTDHLMGNTPQRIKAVIINEKNFMGNQPVDAKFSHSYQFVVNGQVYTGNAHDNTLKVDDTIEVEYNIDHPSINRSLNPKN